MNFQLELSQSVGPNIAETEIGEVLHDTKRPSPGAMCSILQLRRISDSTGFSMDSMFGSVVNISAEELT